MKEFKPSSWQQEPQDLAREFIAHEAAETAPEEQQTAPEEFSKRLVRKGVLNAQTGMHTGNSKQRHMTAWQPNNAYKYNYERTFGTA